MKFSERFVRLPIKIYDKTHLELTGEEITLDSYEMINPMNISSYRPSIDGNDACVHVTFKDGSSMMIYLDIEKFEKIMDEFLS